MDNLEEMDRCVEKFNLPRLNQEEIEINQRPDKKFRPGAHTAAAAGSEDKHQVPLLARSLKRCLLVWDKGRDVSRGRAGGGLGHLPLLRWC